MQQKKIYIAGKITGDENYRERFAAAAKEFEARGYAVMNPAVLPSGFAYREYLLISSAMLSVCDTIFLLDGWASSTGASLEFSRACAYGMSILFENELDYLVHQTRGHKARERRAKHVGAG